MTLGAGRMPRSARARRADRRRHRRKCGPFPLGATRFRLIQALADLGIYAERIATRLRDERRWAQLFEAHRLVRLRDEERAREIVERHRLVRLPEEARIAAAQDAQRRARLRAAEHSELRNEQQRFVRLLKEELAYQSMTEEQKAVERFEEQVVSWLSADESGA